MTRKTAIPGRAKSKKPMLRPPNPKPRSPISPKTAIWSDAAATAKITPRERSIILPLARNSGMVWASIGASIT